MLKRLARTCYRRRWRVLGAGLVFLVAVSFVSSAAGGVFRNEFSLSGSESKQAQELLKERGFGDRAGFSGQIVFATDRGVDDPNVHQAMEQLFAVDRAHGPADPGCEPVLARGRGADQSQPRPIAYGNQLAYEVGPGRQKEARSTSGKAEDLGEQVNVPGLKIELGGQLFGRSSSPEREPRCVLADDHPARRVRLRRSGRSADRDRARRHRSAASRSCSLANGLDMPDFTTQSAAMIRIGVGIDYALFIVTRTAKRSTPGAIPSTAVVSRSTPPAGRCSSPGRRSSSPLLGLLVLNDRDVSGASRSAPPSACSSRCSAR